MKDNDKILYFQSGCNVLAETSQCFRVHGKPLPNEVDETFSGVSTLFDGC